MVGTLASRSWRPYAVPFAILLAATIAIGLVRGQFRGHGSAATARAGSTPVAASSARRGHTAPFTPAGHAGPAIYVVRAGDTVEAIATRHGTTTAKLLKLNPSVSPTALFIGEKIRLR
jgi:LysM repeat protein